MPPQNYRHLFVALLFAVFGTLPAVATAQSEDSASLPPFSGKLDGQVRIATFQSPPGFDAFFEAFSKDQNPLFSSDEWFSFFEADVVIIFVSEWSEISWLQPFISSVFEQAKEPRGKYRIRLEGTLDDGRQLMFQFVNFSNRDRPPDLSAGCDLAAEIALDIWGAEGLSDTAACAFLKE